MSTIPTTSPSSAFPTTSARTVDGVTQIDLNFATAMSKGSGSIFVTDGAVQTVIDRVTGEPGLRVVGGSFTKVISLDQVSISGTHVMFGAAGLPPGANVNVYMGAGTLLSGGKAAGPITVPGSAAFTMPAGDAPPALGATVSIANGVLQAGAPLEMVVTFSHAVSEVPPAVFSAEHARVEYVSHSIDGLSWRFRLVQDDSVDSPSNVVRLDLAAVQPRGAVSHGGTVTSSPYTVDTLVDSYVAPLIRLIHDNGASASDGVTNDPRQVVSGTLVGTIDDGEHLELLINGRTVDPSKISFATENGITTWRYDSESERVGDAPVHLFGDGTNTIQARVVGNGHASPAAARTITVDTGLPDVDEKPDGHVAIDLDADLVITFTEAMHWSADTWTDDPEYKEDVLTIWSGDSPRRIDFAPDWLSGDGLTLRIPAAAHQLMADTGYRIVLPRTLTDTAGNPFGEYEIAFHTDDGLLPSVEGVTVYTFGNTRHYKAGDRIEFWVSFSEDVQEADDAPLSLALNNGGKALLEAVYGKQMLFTYTVADKDDIGHLAIADIAQLAGRVTDLSGKLLDAAHIEFDGIQNGYGEAIDLVIDTTAPAAPAAATLAAASDSGTLGDNITRDASPALRGTAEAHAFIDIYEGTIRLGETVADASGAWSIGAISPLTDGNHAITVVQRDRAGNESAASGALTLTIDTAIPVAPAAPVLVAGSDTGTIGDGITSDRSPTLSGSVEAHATVEIYAGSTLLGSTTANASGAWSATVGAGTPLADGLHNITIRQVDRAGNRSDASPVLALTIAAGTPTGPAMPATPAAAVLAPASDSGALGDGITSDSSPTLSGTVAADATVEIYEGSTLLGTTTATASGAWSATLGTATPLADGAHAITIRQVDGSGNRSAASAPLALTIDTGAPSALSAPVLASESDSGRSDSDGITNERDGLLLKGSGAEPLTEVRIMLGSTVYGIGISDADGYWTVPFSSDPGEGQHTFTVRQVDRAGNLGPASPPVTVTIDRTSPDSAPPRPQLAAASDTGVSTGDGITSDATPTFHGSGAMANSIVALFVDEQEVGSTVTDALGNWSITSTALSDGYHSVGLKQFDTAGNKSGYSESFDLEIDTEAPTTAPAAPDLNAASDSGSSAIDNITNDTTPTFSGSGALAGGEVALFVGSSEVGRVTADASGNWSITTALSHGTHAVRVRQYDLAGNRGPDSDPLSVTIDTQGPTLTDLDGSVLGSLLGRRFDLSFDEAIRFHPNGRFELKGTLGSDEYDAGDSGNGWQIIDSNVLSFNISLNGLLRLQGQNYSVTDLAGNAAVIGVAGWDIPII